MSNKLNIIHVTPEVSPFSKTGGLADVARSLPKALHRLGHKVKIITPFYTKIIDRKKHNLELVFKDLELLINSQEKELINVWRTYLLDDLEVYFIENKKYFSKHKAMYGSGKENARFMVFNVAALKLMLLFNEEIDIIHCHDWQSGLIPYYLKTGFHYSKNLKNAKSIFTIHNLVFQLGHNWWEIPAKDRDYGRSRLPKLNDPVIETINFSKRAILKADTINTVSEQYRYEIMTKKFGQDLHRILKNRKDRLFGIINGIDYNAYNPAKDPGLYKRYSHQDKIKLFSARQENKLNLQRQFNLSEGVNIPILCTTSRLTFQKGFNLILPAIYTLLKQDIQVIIMGDGRDEYIKPIKKIVKQYPKKIVWLSYKGNEDLETSLYASSDIFILPSNHEPCGINQLIAMRYGCIPVVREVGGLYDTVKNFNPNTGRGTGFTFKGADLLDFYGAVIRSLETFKYNNIWQQLVLKAMSESNSWEIPAKKYINLYRYTLRN